MSSSSSSFSLPPISSPPPSASRKRKAIDVSTPPPSSSSRSSEPSPRTPYVSTLTTCPGTVGPSKLNLGPERPFFENAQPVQTGANPSAFQIPTALEQTFESGKVYSIGGRTHSLYKQQSTKDCAVPAFLMLLSDIARHKQPVTIDENFAVRFTNVSLWNANRIQKEALECAGIPLSKTTLPIEKPLKEIQNLIQRTGLPIITAITHPRIDGHWIVVDHIGENESYFRDPMSGMPYKVDNSVMETWYQDEEGNFQGESALYYTDSELSSR